jgi:hypothetical protein
MEEELTMTQAHFFDGRGLKTQVPPIPALICAALILLALNAVIALWFYLSPALSGSTPTANAQSYVEVSSKQSPFEVIQAEKPRKLAKLPPKVTPVFAEVITFEPSLTVRGDN